MPDQTTATTPRLRARLTRLALPVAAFSLLFAGSSLRRPSVETVSVVTTADLATYLDGIEAAGAARAAEPVAVDWKMLGNLDYVNGAVPEALQRLDGKLVKIPGFIVPLEDFEEEGAEFLLVPYFGACVHVPPPPPNQMVYIRMDGGKKIKFGWWDPVWMEGTLKIEHFESPYGAAGFQLTGTKVTPYKAI